VGESFRAWASDAIVKQKADTKPSRSMASIDPSGHLGVFTIG
jgi:hypothetical protein